MKKILPNRYRILPGENITIQVNPSNFGSSLASVDAVLDDKPFAPVAGTDDAPTYQFRATMPDGETHRVFMTFSFQPDAPSGAQYQVDISGEGDVGCPCGFTISVDDLDNAHDISFRVIDEG